MVEEDFVSLVVFCARDDYDGGHCSWILYMSARTTHRHTTSSALSAASVLELLSTLSRVAVTARHLEALLKDRRQRIRILLRQLQ